MGKNHRHKKDLKAEKAKVKLKQSKTKFLPKGQNVTNTSFKIKPIVIPEQLKQKTADDLLSKRKLNVKDLLSRIKHYNENVRNSACEELSDMVKMYTEEIIQQHLSQICLAISSLMQDKEKKVRKSAAKSIEVIWTYVPKEKLVPFYDYFSTNLRCAMTNIDRNIQEDSLLFLDCFIKTNPELITRSSEKLLPDFLSLISKLRSNSELGRTLTLNLGSKMTTVTWKIKVLSRLHAVLSVILSQEHKGSQMSLDSHQIDENVFDASSRGTFPVYNQFQKHLDKPTMDIFYPTKNLSYGNELDTINRHIVTLIPLLYETWLEVMPGQQGQKVSSGEESSILTEELGALLTCITNTLYLLWLYVKKIENDTINLQSVFMCPEGQKFLNHLLNSFPYSHTGARAKKSKKSVKVMEQNSDPRCVHENLLICFLYLVLYVNCTQHNLKKESNSIVSYITKLFFQRSSSLSDGSLQCITELLNECLGENYQKWRRSGVDVHMILENAILFYNHGRFSNDQKKMSLFEVLLKIVDNGQLNRSTKYQNWLSTLPDILCQPSINDTSVSALLELSKKNCVIFHTALIKKLPEILENLGRLQIVITSQSLLHNEEVVKRNLASIFYYVPIYSSTDLHLIHMYINSKASLSRYLQEIMILRNELRS